MRNTPSLQISARDLISDSTHSLLTSETVEWNPKTFVKVDDDDDDVRGRGLLVPAVLSLVGCVISMG